jgi:medium-chain acyl-[acyl-carrier-protein] hydrolase
MIYKEKVLPRLDDCDRKGKLSLKAVLHILENAANHHSLSVADDAVENGLKGIAWVISVWDVYAERLPEVNEELEVSTWTKRGKTTESTSTRQYIIKDAAGTECIRAAAKYALFDIAANSVIRVTPDIIERYKPDDSAAVESVNRVREPKEYDSEASVAVRRGDIDFNRHVHNSVYIDYALEALPESVFDDSFSELTVAYRRPVKEGETVAAKCASSETGYIVGIYNAEGALCTLIEFKK